MDITRHRRSLTLSAIGAFVILVIGAGFLAFGEPGGGTGTGEPKQEAARAIDLAFFQELTRSHRAAVEMTVVARRRGGTVVRQIAADIAQERRSEITLMRQARKRLSREGTRPGDLGVPTSVLRPDLQELRQVKVFDRAFIDMMVAHHRAAMRIARAEILRGSDAAARRLARDILRSQIQEIIAMNDHRRAVFGEASPAVVMPQGLVGVR